MKGSFRVRCTKEGCYLDARYTRLDSAELLAFAHEQRAYGHACSVEPESSNSPASGPLNSSAAGATERRPS